jgi:hypothetical protein
MKNRGLIYAYRKLHSAFFYHTQWFMLKSDDSGLTTTVISENNSLQFNREWFLSYLLPFPPPPPQVFLPFVPFLSLHNLEVF